MDIERELKRELSFAPFIEEILANNAGKIHAAGIKVFTLQKASAKDDTENGFDFVFTMGNFTVPVRIRKPDCRYRDFTIRTRSRGGGRTEIQKLMDGAGDVYFYAWTAFINNAEAIVDWVLIDLHVFRSSYLMTDQFLKTKREMLNIDGTKFISFGIKELEEVNCIICKQAAGKANVNGQLKIF